VKEKNNYISILRKQSYYNFIEKKLKDNKLSDFFFQIKDSVLKNIEEHKDYKNFFFKLKEAEEVEKKNKLQIVDKDILDLEKE
jgi:hypothetical protein